MRCPFAVLLVGAVACSNSPVVAPPVSKPEAPLAPAPVIAAQYALVLVNGDPPPSASPIGAGEWDHDGSTYLLESGTLTLFTNETLTEYWIHRRMPGGALVSQEWTGRYSRLSDSTLQVGVGPGATQVTLTGNGLVWHLPGFTLTYERQQ